MQRDESRQNKRGQLELSFGMIFSIIIIIATVAVAAYFINSFVKTSKCASLDLFAHDFQSKIDEAWQATQARDKFSGKLPEGIEEVCIGKLENVSLQYSKESNAFRRYSELNVNLFMYPPDKACGGTKALFSLKHFNVESLSCTRVKGQKATFNLNKESTDSLVHIKA